VLKNDYNKTFFIKIKNEVFEKKMIFSNVDNVKTTINMKIKTPRINKGGKLLSNDYFSFCEARGICKEFTTSYMSHQNNVIERKNKTILEEFEVCVLKTIIQMLVMEWSC